jgi:hypothetical protein
MILMATGNKGNAVDGERQIGIQEASELLGRTPHAIRTWEYEDVLPKGLWPQRTKRGWRYWTEDQIAGILKWLEDTDRRPGKGLGGPRPTQDQVKTHINHMRGPRKALATK